MLGRARSSRPRGAALARLTPDQRQPIEIAFFFGGRHDRVPDETVHQPGTTQLGCGYLLISPRNEVLA